LKSLRERLDPCDLLILDAVDRDPLLDELDVEDFHQTAVNLEADAVISPDEYLYDADMGHPAHYAHFSRAIRRTIDLVDQSEGKFSIIGLVTASNWIQFSEYVTAVRNEGVTRFAFALGDLLKRGPNVRHVLYELRKYLRFLNDSQLYSLLLGVSSHKIVRDLRPNYWSNSEWSFEAFHNRRNPNQANVNHRSEAEIIARMAENLNRNEQLLKAD
jgi:hypothetical protein